MIRFDKTQSAELVGRKITPPKRNRIVYGQDMSFWRGLPPIEFTICDEMDTMVVLVAPGYGADGDYGNGRVYLDKKDLWPLLETAELRAFDPGI